MEWKVEEMKLMNESKLFIGKERIYNYESKMSREDRIEFVDQLQDGKLTYLLNLIEKFNQDKENMPKDDWGNVKTISLKAWLKRNDTINGKDKRGIVDNWYHYGQFRLLSCERYIEDGIIRKGSYDTYDDLVDEVFHRQLKECENMEKKYFLEHDEYSILKKQVRDANDKYRTLFGLHLVFSSDGTISVGRDEDAFKNNREITIDECKELLFKYGLIEAYIQKLTQETEITY